MVAATISRVSAKRAFALVSPEFLCKAWTQQLEPGAEVDQPAIDAYIGRHRPILARSNTPSGALWLSSNDGAAMTYDGVARRLSATTLAAVGVDISPHSFRAAAATTAAARCPIRLWLAGARSCRDAPAIRAFGITAAGELGHAASKRGPASWQR
jgi:hypothetical protein